MKVLAIDTSNHVLGIAVLHNGELMGEVCTNMKKNHSLRLMPALVSLMEQIEVTPEEIAKIIVAKGPGSYTGVRIGVTTAKTMAWALNIPIVGVSSLEALAYQGSLNDASICPFFDARRKNVFTGLYRFDNQQLKTIYNDTNVAMADWLNILAKQERKILFLSPHLSNFKDLIVDRLGNYAIIPEKPYHIPNPSHLAFVGLEKKPEPVHSLTPNYLRLAEAEANWLKKQKEVR